MRAVSTARGIRQLFGVVLAAAAVVGAPARAQTLVAPRPLGPPAARWPEGEPARTVEVPISLDLDARGRALHARLLARVSARLGAAALQAARRMRFLPAIRGGRPVRSHLRIVVVLTPPNPSTSAEYETVVSTRAARSGSSRRAVGGEEVHRTPGTMGDPFRVIETLPGVMPLASGVPFYYVRGAPPADTGTYFDGVRVPALFHVAVGPSAIHPNLVGRVDFWPGGAPVRFPGMVGGVVAATPAPIPANRPHLDIDLRLVDAGGIAQIPLGRTRASLSGRYSYTAALLSALTPGVDLDYWDYQLRLEHDLDAGTSLTAFAFGSHDLLRVEQDGALVADIKQRFHRVVFGVHRRLGDTASLESSVVLGQERIGLGEGFAIGERSVGARAVLTADLGRAVSLTTGFDAGYQHSNLDEARFADRESDGDVDEDQAQQAFADALEDPDTWEAAVHAELRLSPGPDTVVAPALRASVLVGRQDEYPAVDPRLGWRYELSGRLALKGAIGLYHQRPAFLIPLPGLDSADLRRGLQRATQISQGVEWQPALGLGVDLQLFFHRYENLSDLDFDAETTTPPGPRLDGNAYGFELIVRRALSSRLFGWVAYTLSRNERHFAGSARPVSCPSDVVDALAVVRMPGVTAASEFDRTHILSLTGSYLIGAGVRTGLRVQYRSGHPYTRLRCELDYQEVYDRRNDERTPGYLQLDLRVDKRWSFDAWAFELYFEFINVTFSKDVLSMRQRLRRDGGYGQPIPDVQIPIVIPTLGLRGSF